jgi:putative flippase GtrA
MTRKFSLFILVGGFSAGVNVCSRIVFSIFTSFEIAIVLAFAVGVTTAFSLNKLFVFQAPAGSVLSQYAKFWLVNLVSLAQVWLVAMGLARFAFPTAGFTWHADTIAHLIGVISPVATSYFAHDKFSFRPSRELR